MNILVTLNENYLSPLKVLLNSLFQNNEKEAFSIYLLHSSIPEEKLSPLDTYIQDKGHHFFPIRVDPNMFKDAPVLRHYTSEMYYRLAAHLFLPEHVERILYLDPDIVCINPIAPFYYTDFEGHFFIASEHEHSAKKARLINKLRLRTPNAKGYFNTGVLLMNMALIRQHVKMEEIYEFIEENKLKLILPDQDVFNALFWNKIKPVESCRYNYDARFFELSKYFSKKHDLNWIKNYTIFIHYCGKDKPWHPNYKYTLGTFYQKYCE
ncbi:glycosyl transferase family 8 [Weizmannia acidilactici]|uniref:Glycosyl transferase family 8 n=1 Tax=Weizmannia acidilactici TaxID=2607726 RepID=A0A5J4JM67_9BACI|nr:glycosyltransferase family 8 protein [Weizmannia acidilactici]GER66286.1 glycosyl transferase family 8 [Weizmannia acidilactici]GER71668.1 glycosyl transferase family 8 [Weizmannia acidilactici]GER73975.1 glycosyl transferase family 8 [Weizmannia acidilactici]